MAPFEGGGNIMDKETKKPDLSLVIPTYNEAANIGKVIKRVSTILSPLCRHFEIIVVDDQSSDGTAQIVKKTARKKEKGLATAVMRGWEVARYDVLGVMDGDLQHPPEAMAGLVRAIGDADIAVGSRNVSGGGVTEWSIVRRVVSWGATLLATFILPETLHKVRDPMSGFFLLKSSVIKNVSLNPIGYKILLEVVSRGRFNERKSGSSKAGPKIYWEYLRHLFRLGYETGELYRPVKYFVSGLSGVLVTLSILFLLENLRINTSLAYAMAIESALISNFFVNDFWTFRDKVKGGRIGTGRFQRLFMYNIICFGGQILNIATFSISLWCMPLILSDIDPVSAKIISLILGAGVGFVWNYGANANITWISKDSQSDSKKMYESIEPGYYYKVLEKNPLQRYWHTKKFSEVIQGRPLKHPVLDVGSGPGVLSSLYHVDGTRINLDISYKQLAFSKSKNPDAYNVNGNAYSLPFKDNSIATVFLVELIEHLEHADTSLLFREIRRILKPGGILIVTTPNYLSLWPIIEIIISCIGRIDYTRQHINRYSIKRLVNEVQDAGMVCYRQSTLFIIAPFFAFISERVADWLLSLEKMFQHRMGSILVVEFEKPLPDM
jgi:dolichol-phosphate mannosyltransferase